MVRAESRRCSPRWEERPRGKREGRRGRRKRKKQNHPSLRNEERMLFTSPPLFLSFSSTRQALGDNAPDIARGAGVKQADLCVRESTSFSAGETARCFEVSPSLSSLSLSFCGLSVARVRTRAALAKARGERERRAAERQAGKRRPMPCFRLRNVWASM